MNAGMQLGSRLLAEPHPGMFPDDQSRYIDVDYLSYHINDIANRMDPLSDIIAIEKLLAACTVITTAIGERRGL